MKHLTLSFTLSILLGVVGCTSPDRTEEEETPRHCSEPQNPYDEGSGHYDGYEWAETNNPGTWGGALNRLPKTARNISTRNPNTRIVKLGRKSNLLRF
jgi:hypothetical protein